MQHYTKGSHGSNPYASHPIGVHAEDYGHGGVKCFLVDR